MVQNPKKEKVRNSSIELLRIIAMIMIVFHHFAVHGGFNWSESPVSITRFWYNFIVMGGKIGVDIFVLISGYYLINDGDVAFNLRKVLKFLGQILFYSISIFIFGKLTHAGVVGVKHYLMAFLPISFSTWWFASAYFVLYLLHPFLNKLLHSLDKGAYQKFLLVIVICWSVIPTLTTSLYQSNDLLWFVVLYSIAGYIRLYGLNSKFTAKHYLVFALIITAFSYGMTTVYTFLETKLSFFESNFTYFYGQEKITTLLISLCLFMFFATINMNYHRIINIISSATFGVYLIHDHSVIRNILWFGVFKNAQYQDSILLIPYSIYAVAIVYSVCTLIELLRIHFLDGANRMIVDRLSEKLTRPFEKFFNNATNFFFGTKS